MNNILKKYSIFMNKKYDFSNCNKEIILIDELIKQKVHKEYIFYNVIELTNFYADMTHSEYGDYSCFLQKKLYIRYPFLKDCSEEQLICTLIYSTDYLIHKYGESIALCLIKHLSILISSVDNRILICFIFMHFQKFIFNKQIISYIGGTLFYSPAFNRYIYNLTRSLYHLDDMDIHFMIHDSNIINDIFIISYLNELDINFYKLFWNNLYSEFINEDFQKLEEKHLIKVFLEQFNAMFIFQYFYPTLTNEQIENVIFKIINYSPAEEFYFHFLKHINSSKIEKYKSYQLMQDLRKD